jgi:hypothetical protein
MNRQILHQSFTGSLPVKAESLLRRTCKLYACFQVNNRPYILILKEITLYRRVKELRFLYLHVKVFLTSSLPANFGGKGKRMADEMSSM